MRHRLVALVGICAMAWACSNDRGATAPSPEEVANGRDIFRFDTFGDEVYWTDTLRMHEVIAGAVSPKTPLAVGLKVDADALPPGILGQVNLDDPKTTVALLKLGAVVGVKGTVETVNGQDRLTHVGITCALCHSTVDNSVAPGIGHRLDGWANHDLNVGAIVALSPALQGNGALLAALKSWGPGKYDPRINFDGKNIPAVIPPAYGLDGVRKEIYTGDDTISYWNAYVAVTQMHGLGVFRDPRLGINVVKTPDLVTPKLPALRAYQLSLQVPAVPAGTFDAAAAARGRALFDGTARCSGCHTAPLFTDVNSGKLHTPAEVGQDPAYAARSVTGRYRTTPLRGLVFHAPYFHDGSAATLDAVVAHYDKLFSLNLTAQQKQDLVEYLKSL